MQTSKIFSSIAMYGGLLLGTGNVLANSVDTTESFLLDDLLGYSLNETFTGEFYSLKTFEVTQAGVYELTLTGATTPDDARMAGEDLSAMPLSHLEARVSTHDEKLASLSGDGSLLFDLQPGTHYLKVFAKTAVADANGGLGLELQPYNGDVSTVPVPPALWLLGSGLLGLVGVARRRN